MKHHKLAGSRHFRNLVLLTADKRCGYTNSTVKQNIPGHSPFDPAWYSQVIQATALSHDLDMWPQGDQTIVDSNGIAISGGQKRRIVRS